MEKESVFLNILLNQITKADIALTKSSFKDENKTKVIYNHLTDKLSSMINERLVKLNHKTNIHSSIRKK